MTQDNIRALGSEIVTARAALAAAKGRLDELETAFTAALVGEAAAEFNEAGKSEGDITFRANGVKVKATVPKTVKWDSAKLQAIAAEMPWSTVERLFDIKFGMKESTYKAIPDEALLAKVNEARTTKVGELKVSFIGFDEV